MHEHRREVLRAASVALQGRAVTLWEVSSRAEVTPVMTSAASSQSPDTRLDLDSTLHRWGAPIIQGSRWVGCRLDDTGPWCVAPVRRQPAAPPPDGVERRSRERITLELALSVWVSWTSPRWSAGPACRSLTPWLSWSASPA